MSDPLASASWAPGAATAAPLRARAQASRLLARQAAGEEAAAQPQRAALGQQFEALLLRQLVEAMSATVPDSGLTGGASGPKTLYQSMITDALATQVARSGGLGIARLLEPTLGAGSDPSPPSTPGFGLGAAAWAASSGAVGEPGGGLGAGAAEARVVAADRGPVEKSKKMDRLALRSLDDASNYKVKEGREPE